MLAAGSDHLLHELPQWYEVLVIEVRPDVAADRAEQQVVR